MKKVLFATTALIATASVAAADVSFSGSARFGAKYTGKVGAVKATTDVTTRYNLDIKGSAEADNGLTFGTKFRMRSNGNGTNQPSVDTNGAEFTMSSNGLTVALGNTSGAIDSMNGLYANEVGLTALAGMYTNHGMSYQGYGSNGAGTNADDTSPGVSVKYAAGDFGVMVSSHKSGTESYNALNASYTFSGWTVALGYQDVSDSVAANKAAADAKDLTALTVTGNVGIASMSALVSSSKAGTGVGIGASFEVGAATTVTAVASSFNSKTAGVKNSTAYGLGVAHDLGGATLKAGIASSSAAGATAVTTADLGVSFSF